MKTVNLLLDRQTIHRPDLCHRDEVQSQRPPPTGMESALYQYEGTNIFQWYARKNVYWESHGELMVIEEQSK